MYLDILAYMCLWLFLTFAVLPAFVGGPGITYFDSVACGVGVQIMLVVIALVVIAVGWSFGHVFNTGE